MPLEIQASYKFIIQHPKEKTRLEITFLDKEEFELWIPYLRKIENVLMKENNAG